jgi:UDP-N-acetylmuramoyl-tripeptide--D-alanyl-D-alanine ligase
VYFAIALAGLASAVAAWRAWRRTRFFLHVLQLEGYKRNEYGAWLIGRGRTTVWGPSHAVGAATLGITAGVSGAYPYGAPIIASLVWLVAFASDAPWSTAREKKPLAYTDRMRRLAGVAVVFAAAPVAAGAAWSLESGSVLPLLGGWLTSDLGAPLWVLIAASVMHPVERAIQEGFKRRAQARLATRPDLTVIAITGSYGKTSTKFAVAEVLRQRFNTLATPGSFNTPMGICKVVNDQLRDDHRVVVLEMGARYEHDIRELTDLVQPDIAVVTSVGVAHLETMGPIERIARVKGDLVAGLKLGGQAVLNADDPLVAGMTDRLPAGHGRVWMVSAGGAEDADVVASDVSYDSNGARFTVRDDTGDTVSITTRLLGEHNVTNLLLAIGVGRAMGLRLRQIAHAIERVAPVDHRLALRTEDGVTVIDDAFNSNPVGARSAVEILGRMPVPPGGRRAIVTPGMVELGARQEEENRAFGAAIAQHLAGDRDMAILVGPRQTQPIRDGLADAGFPAARVRVVRTLFEARDLLRQELRDGDVVLYENDLPDHYDERS